MDVDQVQERQRSPQQNFSSSWQRDKPINGPRAPQKNVRFTPGPSNNNSRPTPPNNKRKDEKCFRCQQPGHRAVDCRVRINELSHEQLCVLAERALTFHSTPTTEYVQQVSEEIPEEEYSLSAFKDNLDEEATVEEADAGEVSGQGFQ